MSHLGDVPEVVDDHDVDGGDAGARVNEAEEEDRVDGDGVDPTFVLRAVGGLRR